MNHVAEVTSSQHPAVAPPEGLENHLEASASLHCAVALLWEGVGGVLEGYHFGTNSSGGGGGGGGRVLPPHELARHASLVVPLPTAVDSALSPTTAITTAADQNGAAQEIHRMLREEELVEIPTRLEGLPLIASADALSVDVERVQASAKFLINAMMSATAAVAAAETEAAAATAAAAAGAAAAAAAPHNNDDNEKNDNSMEPVAEPPVLPLPQSTPRSSSISSKESISPTRLSDRDGSSGRSENAAPSGSGSENEGDHYV